jgi:hypothetical protein
MLIDGAVGLQRSPSREAMRQAMLAYLNDASSPRNAYPAVCADQKGRRALKFSNCAMQHFPVNPGSGGWSRNHDRKPA